MAPYFAEALNSFKGAMHAVGRDKKVPKVTATASNLGELNQGNDEGSPDVNREQPEESDELDFTSMDFPLSRWEDFAEDFNLVLDILGPIAQAFPFVKVAVDAFQAAVRLELTREKNDRRATVLLFEIREMMLGSTQLVGRSPRLERPIEKILAKLYKRTAVFIQKCSATCNMYKSQHFLVQLVQAKSFERKLTSLSEIAQKQGHRIEKYLSLLLHVKVDEINNSTQTLNAKIKRMEASLKTFSPKKQDIRVRLANLRPHQDYEVDKFMEQHGGRERVASNPGLLRKMFSQHGGNIDENTIRDLNVMASFDERLEESQKMFQEFFREFQEYVGRQGNGVTEWTTRIAHPDVREVWERMGWKSAVHPRELFIELRGYYIDLYSKSLTPSNNGAKSSSSSPGDSNAQAAPLTDDDKAPPADTPRTDRSPHCVDGIPPRPHTEFSTSDVTSSTPIQAGYLPSATSDFVSGALADVSDEGDPDDSAVAEDTVADSQGADGTEIEAGEPGPPADEEAGIGEAAENEEGPEDSTQPIDETEVEVELEFVDGGYVDEDDIPDDEQPSQDSTTYQVLTPSKNSSFLKGIAPGDAWTLRHMSVQGLRCLIDVLDPDTSDSVTVAEVNSFTASCPTTWRLPKLLAYWTSGIPLSVKRYSLYIRLALRCFLNACESAPMECSDFVGVGREWALHVERCIAGLESQSFMHMPFDAELLRRFEDHIGRAEEDMSARLGKNYWALGSSNAVVLLIGDAEVDHRYLMLLYLMTARLARAMRQRRSEANDSDNGSPQPPPSSDLKPSDDSPANISPEARTNELVRLRRSMDAIIEAMYDRLENLRATVSSQGEEDNRLEYLGFGMYRYLYRPIDYELSDHGRFFASTQEQLGDRQPESASNGLDPMDPIEIGPNFIPNEAPYHSKDSAASESAVPVADRWVGFYRPTVNGYPQTATYSLGRISLHISGDKLTGYWYNFEGGFDISGRVEAGHPPTTQVSFRAKSTGKNGSYRKYQFKGTISHDRDMIQGSFSQIIGKRSSTGESDPRSESQATNDSVGDVTGDVGYTNISNANFLLARVRSSQDCSMPYSVPPEWPRLLGTYEEWRERFNSVTDAKGRYIEIYQKCYYPVLASAIRQPFQKTNVEGTVLSLKDIGDLQAIELFYSFQKLDEVRYTAGGSLIDGLLLQTKRYLCPSHVDLGYPSRQRDRGVEQDSFLQAYSLEQNETRNLCDDCATATICGFEYSGDVTPRIAREKLPDLKTFVIYQLRRELNPREMQETRLRAVKLTTLCREDQEYDSNGRLSKSCVNCTAHLGDQFWLCVDCEARVWICSKCRSQPIPLKSIGSENGQQQASFIVGKSEMHGWFHTLVYCAGLPTTPPPAASPPAAPSSLRGSVCGDEDPSALSQAGTDVSDHTHPETPHHGKRAFHDDDSTPTPGYPKRVRRK